MAWRNIWRNPRRTLLTAGAISFAAMLLIFMLSLQFGSYATMINASVKIHTGHIQVQADGYHENQRMRMVVPNPKEIGAILDRIPRVTAYTYRANAFSLISSSERTYGALVIGVDPEREAAVSTLKKTTVNGNDFSSNSPVSGEPPALVGHLLALNLNVGIGDELTIIGQGRDGSVAATVARVTGIFKSGLDDFDRNTIQIPLSRFQEIYTMSGAVHEVVMIGDDLGDIPEIKKHLVESIRRIDPEKKLAVMDWEALMPGLRQAITMDLVSGLIMYLILIIVVAFSILNTFLMAIFERTREFGVLMAIGARPGRISRLLMAESTILTLIGIMMGIITGVLITAYFQINGIDLSGSSELLSQYGITGSIHPRLSVLSILIGPALVLVITLCAALYPALKIKRMKPVEAMTHA